MLRQPQCQLSPQAHVSNQNLALQQQQQQQLPQQVLLLAQLQDEKSLVARPNALEEGVMDMP